MRNRSKIVAIVLSALVMAGLAAWLAQLRHGLILTNMRNSFTWGLYIATWAFFVGTAAGGLVVSSAIYLFGAHQLKPIAHIASLTAFLFATAAMIVVLPDIGRPDRLFHILLHPNLTSMLFWDVIVLSSYAAVSAVYTYILLRPAILRHGIVVPGMGVLGRRPMTPEALARETQRSQLWARRLAPLALPLAILIHTVTAWVLATQLGRSWWFGGALAPSFIAAALATGPAVVILAALFVYGFNATLAPTYRLLAKISLLASAALLFIYYNDFFVKLWWNGGREAEAVKLMFEHYAWLHLVEVVAILASMALFARAVPDPRALVAGSWAVIVGVLAHRLLLIPPAYNLIPLRVPYVAADGRVVPWSYPIAIGEIRGVGAEPQPVFTSFWPYVPSLVEVAIVCGIVAGLCLAFAALVRILPLRREVPS